MTTTINAGRALWRPLMWGGAAALLVLPAVAMRVSDEVDWTASDFILAGVFLGGAALLVELVMRRGRAPAHQAGVCLAVLAGLLLVWVTGAVGIIGSEEHPANLLYGAVLVAAVVGSVLARFRPGGMAVAMGTAALLQVAIGVAALVAGWGADEPDALRTLVGVNGVFALMWTVSALLLRQAARPTGN